MNQTSQQILQKTIIETLDSKIEKKSEFKKDNFNILNYLKAKIKNITEEEVLVKIADKINEENFLENLNFEGILAFITSIQEEVWSIVENNDWVLEHSEAVCTNAMEVMSHSIIVRAIKWFYKDKLDLETNNINPLSDKEKENLEENYWDSKWWDKYSVQIIFAIEHFDDFLIYLFENNYIEENDKFPDDKLKLFFNILSTIKADQWYYRNLKNSLEKKELEKLNSKNIKIFWSIKNLEEFFEIIDWKKFFKVVDLKNFFDVVKLKEFFEIINLEIEVDNEEDLIINYLDKTYSYYKELYIQKGKLFMIEYNSDDTYTLNLENWEKEEVNIKEIPEDAIKIYDKDNLGFTEYYE